MKKKDKTASTEKESDGYPVYLTVNASNNPALVGYAIKTAMEEAHEYKQLLYVTVNSGNPPNPPLCPPGMNCDPK